MELKRQLSLWEIGNGSCWSFPDNWREISLDWYFRTETKYLWAQHPTSKGLFWLFFFLTFYSKQAAEDSLFLVSAQERHLTGNCNVNGSIIHNIALFIFLLLKLTEKVSYFTHMQVCLLWSLSRGRGLGGFQFKVFEPKYLPLSFIFWLTLLCVIFFSLFSLFPCRLYQLCHNISLIYSIDLIQGD